MSKENQFIINDYKYFKTKLLFNVQTWEEYHDAEVEISCGEDIEEVMKLYFKKDWKTLFYDYNETNNYWYKDVCGVEFEGIQLVANEENKGHIHYLMTQSNQKIITTVHDEVLKDKNAEKIKQIREIIKS